MGGYYGGIDPDIPYNNFPSQRRSHREVPYEPSMSYLRHSRSEARISSDYLDHSQRVQSFSHLYEPYNDFHQPYPIKQHFPVQQSRDLRHSMHVINQFGGEFPFRKVSTQEDLYHHQRSQSVMNGHPYIRNGFPNHFHHRNPSSDLSAGKLRDKQAPIPRDPISRLTKPQYEGPEQRHSANKSRAETINAAAIRNIAPKFPKDFFNPRTKNKSIS